MSVGSAANSRWRSPDQEQDHGRQDEHRVSGLRRALGEAGPELVWTGSGYRLTGARIDDLCERRELLRGAITAREAGDLRQAGELAGEAESLWRGEYAEG